MERIIRYIIPVVILLNISFSDDLFNYKIKYFGIYAADCTIDIKDTLYSNQNVKRISFIVKTKPLFNFLFPVNNIYSIILNEDNRILSFKKNTSQPQVTNSLYTVIRDDKVFYDNSNFEILPNYYNIFSILYIMISKREIPDNCIIEREGLLYDLSINFNENKSMYVLNLENKNNSVPIIEDTDMFTWALFMDNCKRKIFVNPETALIEKCVFSKGLINITAELYLE
tara:strand:+ start:224 stop:904 length:681 start_codon:yes stop_codon:yes gene_type:complete